MLLLLGRLGGETHLPPGVVPSGDASGIPVAQAGQEQHTIERDVASLTHGEQWGVPIFGKI